MPTILILLFFCTLFKTTTPQISFPTVQSQQRLIFETEICPSLQTPRPSNLSVSENKDIVGGGSIVLHQTCGVWMNTDTHCDCNFTVTTTTLASNPLTVTPPTHAQLVGVTMTNDKRFPWPTRKKRADPLCKIPVQIYIDGSKWTRKREMSRTFCSVTNQFLATPNKSPQWGIWKEFQPLPIVYQVESGRLAVTVGKELDFTLQPKSSIKFHSSFVHFVFIFRSAGDGCYMRIEHFKILKPEDPPCDLGETTGCEILPCSEEIRLGWIMRKMWHERFYYGHKNTSRSVTYALNQYNSIASMNPKRTEERGGVARSLMPMILLFKICIVVIVLGLRQNKKKRRTLVSSDQTQPHQAVVHMNFASNSHTVVILPEDANYNVPVAAETPEYMEAKDPPPTYVDVLAMDKLSPPAYSDIFPSKTVPLSAPPTAV